MEEEEADKEEVDKKGKEEDKEEQKKEDREDKAEQGDHLEAGQPDESDEGDAEAHAHEVHEGPVAGEHPHADHRDGDGDREELGQGEPAAQPQRDLAALRCGGAGADQVLGGGDRCDGDI